MDCRLVQLKPESGATLRTVQLNALELFAIPSLTETMTLYGLFAAAPALIVPLIRPVLELIASPGGKPLVL